MAWNMAIDRPLGGGFQSFQPGTFAQYAPDPARVHDSHSIYFGTLGHHGFVGLALFLTLLAMTWLKCGSTLKSASRSPDLLWARDLSAMIQTSLAAYLSAGAFLGLMYFDYVYHLVALSVVVHELVRQSVSADRPVAVAVAVAESVASPVVPLVAVGSSSPGKSIR
jgi:probable O-glycosylation ligase (exosortase A-associated)